MWVANFRSLSFFIWSEGVTETHIYTSENKNIPYGLLASADLEKAIKVRYMENLLTLQFFVACGPHCHTEIRVSINLSRLSSEKCFKFKKMHEIDYPIHVMRDTGGRDLLVYLSF